MSSELDKLTNRIRELDGRKFTKIPQVVIRLEREIELIREEIAEEKINKAPLIVIQKFESQLIAALRALQEVKRKK